MNKFDYMFDEPEVKKEKFSYMFEEEKEEGWLSKLKIPGIQVKRHIPLVEAMGDIFRPKPRERPSFPMYRTIDPLAAPQATTEVVTPPPPIPPTMRPLTEEEQEAERPHFKAPPPGLIEEFEKTTKNIYRGVKRALEPGDDPLVNATKGLIGFFLGIPEFISEMGETALEVISAGTPEESTQILKKKGGEMVTAAAQTLQNLAWLISYSISPIEGGSREEYDRRQGEFLQDPSAPVITAWIARAVGRSIGKIPKGKMAVKAGQIVDYVKSQDVLLRRQRGKEVPVMPTKEPALGEGIMRDVKELQKRGVTEKPAPTGEVQVPLAVKLKDGTVVTSKTALLHNDLIREKGIRNRDIVSTGIMRNNEYVEISKTKPVTEKPAEIPLNEAKAPFSIVQEGKRIGEIKNPENLVDVSDLPMYDPMLYKKTKIYDSTGKLVKEETLPKRYPTKPAAKAVKELGEMTWEEAEKMYVQPMLAKSAKFQQALKKYKDAMTAAENNKVISKQKALDLAEKKAGREVARIDREADITVKKLLLKSKESLEARKRLAELRVKPVTEKPAEIPAEEHAYFREPTELHAGIPLPQAIKEVTRLTSEIIKKATAKPEIRAGVKKALEAMIEHDRQIRDGEFAHKKLEQTFERAVPDKSRQLAIVHAVQQKRNPKYYNQLSLEEKSIVRWMETELTKMEAFNKKHKITEIKELPEGVRYVPGYWINPQTGKPYPLMYGKLSKGLPQAKQKVFATYEEGMRAGSKMATTNLGDIIGGAWESLIRAQQSRAMFKTLHNVAAEKGVEIQLRKGSKKKGVRMVERWDLLNKQGLTEDYIRYSHWSLDKAIAFKDVNGNMVRLKGAVGVHKSLFPFVKAYLENPNYGTFSKLNFASKSLKLTFSFFHVVSLAMQEAANWRTPFVNIPRGARFRRDLDPVMRILHREALDLFKGYEDIGYRNKFFEGQNWWGKAGNIATKPIELMRNFIFDVVQPNMKASFAHDQYVKLLPKYLKKGLTEAQCAREVVRAADGHFSHEHWKRSLLETNRTMVKLYFMPEARRMWQNVLLSPTWQREHMLVAKDVMKSFMPDRMIKKLGMREMGPIKGEYRKYALGAITMFGAADLYNLYATNLMDGKALHLWENPEGKKGFYVRAPWNEPSYTITDKDEKERTIPGAPAYIRPFKSIGEVAGWFGDPVEKFTYKLAPAVAAMGRQMFPSRYQKEYEGVIDMPRRAKEFLLDVGTPISGSQAGLVFKGKKKLVSAVFPFFGMPTSKLKRAQTKELYYGKLSEIEKEYGRGTKWQEAKKEFEDLGYKFNVKAYLEHKKGK